MKYNENGLVIYDGPSAFDGEKIICVATGLKQTSSNEKTGNMIQTWILRKDINPVEAIQEGLDESVCGSCRFRNGSCYVNWHTAPYNIWHTFHNGRYRYANKKDVELFRNRVLRMGSAGDPASMPISIWQTLLKYVSGHSAYSHAWRYCDQKFRKFTMASVDTVNEAMLAKKMGWRYFRTRNSNEILEKELVCPASKEENKRLTCETCQACSGNPNERGGSVTITVHGDPIKLALYKQLETKGII